MPTLRQQIDAFFEDLEPDVRQVVLEVLSIEQEFIHMKNPRGIMPEIDQVLQKVAGNSVKAESANEN